MKKFNNKTLLGFILGAVIFSGIGVVAGTIYAKDITYTKNNDTNVTVQKAIDELYNKSNNLNVKTINIYNEELDEDVPKNIILTPSNDSLVGFVYFNPANLYESCDAANAKIDTSKTGCMKWYVYDQSETSYGLLLDHNLTGKTNAATVNSNLESLKTTYNWQVTPQLMPSEDVAKVTKSETEWQKLKNHTSREYYFDTGTRTAPTNVGAGTSKYYWLFDNTFNCKSYGCRDMVDSTSYEYYLIAKPQDDVSSGKWNIGYQGMLLYSSNPSVGLRPIVVVSK